MKMRNSAKNILVLTVNGMSCKHCVHSVESVALSVDGVKKAKASLKDNTLTAYLIDGLDTQAVISMLIERINSEGFEALN